MAKFKSQPIQVTVTATLVLDEEELFALDALAGYGIDAFLETFYTKMGQAYLRPHEDGLRRLFEAVQVDAKRIAESAAKARDAIAHLEK